MIKIAKNATIVGDVILKNNVNIWYGAVIRGDECSIIIDENSNIQDNCVIHGSYGYNVKIGKNVTVGHSAIVHGCTIEDNVLIGMGTTILDGASIGKGSIIGANSLITKGKIIPPNSLVIGSPFKIVREVTEDEIKETINNSKLYIKLSENIEE